MTDHSEIRTRADGSIDTGHYIARGREMRSAAFLTALDRLCRRALAIGTLPVGRKTRDRPAAARRTVPGE